jgi:hypothetical protein
LPIDRTDPQIRDFILHSQAETWSDMAAEVLGRFGAERAWPAELIAEVRREMAPPKAGYASKYQADNEVMDFIGDRADLLTIDTILERGGAQFGPDRFPSRSHLHRLILSVRKKPAQEATPCGVDHQPQQARQ